jgi:hypothetical protein
MHILHAHYKVENMGGILFWAETSDVGMPKQARAVKKAQVTP